MSFTKLDGGIVDSTIWVQPHDVLRVWIAMLAKSGATGYVRASVPAMALLCMVTLERMEEILAILESPDQYSRTEIEEGRRLRKTEGGWEIVNYLIYRNARDEEDRREYQRQWDRDHRPSGHARSKSDVSPTQSDSPTELRHSPTQAEAEADKEQELSNSAIATLGAKPSVSPCPYQQILELFHEKLPRLPRVRELTDERKAKIKARWHNGLGSLDRWGNYFAVVEKSDFLMGRCDPSPGRSKPFVADIDFLIRKSTVVKIAEGKYHG